MASIDTSPQTNRRAVKVVGFVAGMVVCLCLGALGKALYSQQGLGDFDRTPPQVYTNF